MKLFFNVVLLTGFFGIIASEEDRPTALQKKSTTSARRATATSATASAPTASQQTPQPKNPAMPNHEETAAAIQSIKQNVFWRKKITQDIILPDTELMTHCDRAFTFDSKNYAAMAEYDKKSANPLLNTLDILGISKVNIRTYSFFNGNVSEVTKSHWLLNKNIFVTGSLAAAAAGCAFYRFFRK